MGTCCKFITLAHCNTTEFRREDTRDVTEHNFHTMPNCWRRTRHHYAQIFLLLISVMSHFISIHYFSSWFISRLPVSKTTESRINGRWIGSDQEGICHVPIGSRLEATDVNNEYVSQDIRCPRRDLNKHFENTSVMHYRYTNLLQVTSLVISIRTNHEYGELKISKPKQCDCIRFRGPTSSSSPSHSNH
jgi:hypothetical protein